MVLQEWEQGFVLQGGHTEPEFTPAIDDNSTNFSSPAATGEQVP